MGSLYYENFPYAFFEKMNGSNLVINNYGLFTHHENGKPIWKNPENARRVAKFLKYLFMDEKEIKYAAQKETINEAAKYFLNLGTGMVIVTQGSRGSMVFTKDKEYKIPAFKPKKMMDTTGAGDTYLAGFIFATQLFDDIQKQGKFAAMVATMGIEKDGAFTGNLKEVGKRLKSENINL